LKLPGLIFLTILCVVCAGCGAYKTTPGTAKGVQTIHIPFFVNKTSEPDLELTITERFINNLIVDNTLKVVDEDDADALLDGVIISFSNRPFSFNRELNAEEYLVVITVRATLFDRKTNTPIWEAKSFRGDGSYFLESSDRTYLVALDESIKEITDQILNITVQDW